MISADGYKLPNIKVDVQVGINNCYKNGLWTPVRLNWTEFPPETKLSIQCSDADGAPIEFPCQYGKTAYIRTGRANEKLTIKINGNVIQYVNVPKPTRAEKPIYLVIGNEDIGLQGAVAELALREEMRPVLVKVPNAANLPDHPFGYDAVHTVVLTTSEPKFFEGLTSESPQIKALETWLRNGGRMLFVAGKDAGQYLEKPDGALRPFLPGKFSEMTELRQGTPFENYINSKRAIHMTGTTDAPFMRMPRFTEPQGIIFVKDGDCPLLLRAAHGLGTLIYFGGDLSGKPLGAWRDRVKLVSAVMQWDSTRNNQKSNAPPGNSMLQLGYNDIAGQIRSALDRFDNVRVIPFSVILILLTAYWLAVGLLDWLLIRRFLNRPLWTWFTFPLWIVLFSALAYGLAAASRSDKILINELALVDIDTATNTVRLTNWGNLYSPNDAQYSPSLSADHRSLSVDYRKGEGEEPDLAFLSFNGLPGSGLGGMDPKTVNIKVWQTGSGQQDFETLNNVPVQVRSTKSFFGQMFRQPNDRSYPYYLKGLRAELRDEEGIPVGAITAGELTPVLENALLIYGRWVLDLGTIQPKQVLNVGKRTPRKEMFDLLITSNLTADQFDENVERYAAYNPQSANIDYIVRVMTLQTLLGGFETTRLHHSFYSTLNMSDLMTTDRALLLANVKNDISDTLSASIAAMPGGWKLKIPKPDNPIKNRNTILRQVFPIQLTVLSPRLKLEQQHFKSDELEQKINPASVKEKASDYNPGFR
ncbi:hypothetical protein FACS189443_3130 [Planctomycetales bacterium]|nr:hypothetical protein FACS189443_3130 [Planctomycetales bacterium]